MTLRTRLLLGYGYLVALLLVCAGSSAIGFHSLSLGIDVILSENVESVDASTKMLEALERQDSETLRLLLDVSASADNLAHWEEEFGSALDRARDNITIAAERPIIDAISNDFDAYRQSRDRLLASHPDRPLRAYEAQTYPAFSTLKERVFAMLDLNHTAMREADARARRSAVRSGAWIGALVLIALVSFIVLSRMLQRDLLARLEEVREVTSAIAAGDRRRRIPVTREDELGMVAARLNDSLDSLDAVHGEMQALANLNHQLIRGLLQAIVQRAALFELDGCLVAATLPESEIERLDPIRRWIERQGRDRPDRPPAGDDGAVQIIEGEGAERWTVRLVVLDETRPLGWLASRQAPPAAPS